MSVGHFAVSDQCSVLGVDGYAMTRLICSFYDRGYMEIWKRDLEKWKDVINSQIIS